MTNGVSHSCNIISKVSPFTFGADFASSAPSSDINRLLLAVVLRATVVDVVGIDVKALEDDITINAIATR